VKLNKTIKIVLLILAILVIGKICIDKFSFKFDEGYGLGLGSRGQMTPLGIGYAMTSRGPRIALMDAANAEVLDAALDQSPMQFTTKCICDSPERCNAIVMDAGSISFQGKTNSLKLDYACQGNIEVTPSLNGALNNPSTFTIRYWP